MARCTYGWCFLILLNSVAFGSLEDAKELFKNGQYAQAATLYESVLATATGQDALTVQGQLFYAYLKLGDSRKATVVLNNLKTAFVDHKNIAMALLHAAKACEWEEMTAKANEIRQYTIDNFPDHKGALLSRVELIRQSDNRDVLVNDMKSAFTGNLLATGLRKVAHIHRDEGDSSKALELYQYNLTNLSNTRAAMMSHLDIVLYYLKDAGDSDRAFTETKSLISSFHGNGGLAKLLYRLALQFRLYGRDDVAAFLCNLVSDTPNGESVLMARIIEYYLLNDDPNKAAEIADAIELPEVSNSARLRIAEMYYEKGSYDDALSWCGTLDNPESYMLSAMCHKKLLNYDQVVTRYEQIITRWPDWNRRWNVMFKLGRLVDEERTKVIYQELVEKYPSCKAYEPALKWLSDHES